MSKRFKYFIFVACIFFCEVLYAADNLSVFVFEVGEASFLIARKGTNALVIDAGCESRSFALKPYASTFCKFGARYNELQQAISGATKIIVIYTHNHDDHYNLRQFLFPMAEVIKGWENNARDKVNQLNNDAFLGNDVTITPIVTHPWPQGGSEHNHNMMVKVTCAGIGILFTGDASGKLIDRLLSEQPDTFNNIHCMFLSHHGANQEGELDIFRAVREKLPHNFPLLTLVSSNPSGRDKLPCTQIARLRCGNLLENNNCRWVDHDVTVRGAVIDDTVEFGNPQSFNIDQPIFVTYDVRGSGYYKIVISPDYGGIQLYDGAKPRSLFYFFHEEQGMFHYFLNWLKADIRIQNKQNIYSDREIAEVTGFQNQQLDNFIGFLGQNDMQVAYELE